MTMVLICVLSFLWCLVIYHHLIYPIILLKVLNKQSFWQPPLSASAEGTVINHSMTILVPVFNEADVIADKIRNVASLDYPLDQLNLIIACDGCSDNSADIARATAQELENKDLAIEIIEFANNRGKVAVLNQLIPKIKSDIVALSDASALISFDGLHIANKHFNCPNIGVVAATYQFLNPGSTGEQKYWDYQVKIKKGEAALGSPIGVHGALYFFRKALFTPLPSHIINDDFVLPMKIIAQGFKGIYANDVLALELEQASLDMDHKRRIRIAAGNLQQLLHLTPLLLPKHGATAFNFISGKALRALMPLILLLQFITCFYLAQDSDLFQIITGCQLIGIFLARLSLLPTNSINTRHNTTKINSWLKPLLLLSYLINGYISGLIGTVRYILGLERGCWKPVSKKEKTL